MTRNERALRDAGHERRNIAEAFRQYGEQAAALASPPSTKLGELMHLTASALHERAAYIVMHADAIMVRVELYGRWQNLALADLPPELAIREAFRLLLRAETPHRKLRDGEARPEASDGV